MSTAIVDAWVTRTGDPCGITPREREFSIYVLECNGRILEWCGKKYSNMLTKCGHLEFELPPGCYIVGAVLSPSAIGTSTGKSLGNHLTHIAVVRVNCGDHVCVTLFDSSLHVCGTWIGAAINTYVANPRMREQLGAELFGAMQNAAAAVERMVKLLPPDPIGETTRALAAVPQPRQPAADADEAPRKASKKGASKKGR